MKLSRCFPRKLKILEEDALVVLFSIDIRQKNGAKFLWGALLIGIQLNIDINDLTL